MKTRLLRKLCKLTIKTPCRNIAGRQGASGGGAAAAGQAQAEGQAAAASGGARFRADQNRTDGGFAQSKIRRGLVGGFKC